MDKDEALKLALEALEAMQSYAAAERKGLRICDEAITTIKEALAQPAQEQEEDWGVIAEKQLASIKRDTQASFEDAMVRVTHKVMAEREAQPAQEPVAWGFKSVDGSIYDCISPESHDDCEGEYNVPLYTKPPQRPWVGLTEEDRKVALLTAYKEWECDELLLCAREDYLLIEQALKEKNA
jgi:hypothetical protein